jgi:RimJ/RimL family protein N-acetyltransferase
MFKIVTAKDGRKVVIRSIVPSDIKRAKEFADCLNSVIAEGIYIIFTKKCTVKGEKEWIKKAIARVREDHFTFVAECDGKVVGTATIAREIGTMSHVATAGLMIRKGYREIGIGSMLMQALVKTAEQMKVKIFKLDVFATNKRAWNLYKKFGFKQVGRIQKHDNLKGKLVDRIILIKKM